MFFNSPIDAALWTKMADSMGPLAAVWEMASFSAESKAPISSFARFITSGTNWNRSWRQWFLALNSYAEESKLHLLINYTEEYDNLIKLCPLTDYNIICAYLWPAKSYERRVILSYQEHYTLTEVDTSYISIHFNEYSFCTEFMNLERTFFND